MPLEKSPPRPRRSSIEQEEEKAWTSFYQRVGNDTALATEILRQLDSDAPMKRTHLALYLCCKKSLQVHKARHARNQRIGQLVRWCCSGLATLMFVNLPQAIGRVLRRGHDLAVECLPKTRTEPAIALASRLAQDDAIASAQADFQRQRNGAVDGAPATGDDIETSTRTNPAIKAG